MGDVTVKISVYCIPAKNKFCNLTGTFKAEDGSELFFSIAEGQMECNKGPNCDYFDYTFNDVAVINGGTGRFSDAFGSFHPNALVHNAKGREWNALFSCNGNIHLVPPSKPSPGDLINEP